MKLHHQKLTHLLTHSSSLSETLHINQMASAAIASLFLVVASGFTPAPPRAWRASTVMMASDSGDLSRRSALAGAMAAAMIPSSPARAFGPETIELRDLTYSDTGKIKGRRRAPALDPSRLSHAAARQARSARADHSFRPARRSRRG